MAHNIQILADHEQPQNKFNVNAINLCKSTLHIHTVVKTNTGSWTANVKVDNRKIKFKIESNTEINVSPKKVHQNLSPQPTLKKTSIRLPAYNNTNISVLG